MKKKTFKLLNKLKILIIYFMFITLIITSLLTFSFSYFSEKDVMKDFYISHYLNDSTLKEKGATLYDLHKQNCLKGYTEQIIPTNNGNKTVSCGIVLDSSTTKFNYGLKIEEFVIFEDQYNKNYQCTFLQCLMSKENRKIIYTSQGNFYLNNVKMFLILGTIICGLLFLISFDHIKSALNAFGFAFFTIGSSFFISKLFSSQFSIVNEALNIIFEYLNPILIIFMITGLFLIIMGLFIEKEETWGSFIEKHLN